MQRGLPGCFAQAAGGSANPGQAVGYQLAFLVNPLRYVIWAGTINVMRRRTHDGSRKGDNGRKEEDVCAIDW